MPRYIVIVGTLDTKGDQLAYIKEKIEAEGQPVCVIDIGVVGDTPFGADHSRRQVARAAGTSIEKILAMNDRRAGLEKMGQGAAKIIRMLFSKNELAGVLAAGGSQGTAVALQVMKAVPLGVPKLLLSTIAYSPVITPATVGGDDLMMLPWVAGLWGLNSLSRQSLETAAGAIAGAARAYIKRTVTTQKIVGVSSLGGAVNQYMADLKPALEGRGYEVAVFHVLGMPGRMFERALSDGLISFSLDLSVGVELLNEVTGGVYTAGEHRLEAASRMGIPQIVSPGAIEIFHWGKDRPFPAKYKGRPWRWHSGLHMAVRSNAGEMAAVGGLMAEKLNLAKGPVTVVLPLQGSGPMPAGPLSGDGTAVEVEKGWAGFRRNIKRQLKPGIRYVELDVTFNDPLYTKTVLELFDEMTKEGQP
jgi:uncharacterized protein (UPF0261 family)